MNIYFYLLIYVKRKINKIQTLAAVFSPQIFQNLFLSTCGRRKDSFSLNNSLYI